MERKGLLLVILLSIFTAGVISAEVQMPYLLGLSEETVRELLASKFELPADSVKILVSPDSFYTDSLAAGTIYWQEPSPDSMLEKPVIRVRLTAPFSIELPDIRGMPTVDASTALSLIGLSFTPLEKVESEEYPAGTVIETTPDPGDTVQRGRSIGAVISMGKIERTPVLTSDGIPITLYEDPSYKITSISVASPDSSGFVLSFAINVTSPYEHSFKAEDFSIQVRVNGGMFIKKKLDSPSISLGPKAVARSTLKVPIAYSEISPAFAEVLLETARYRITGTYAVVTESGFSRKPINTEEYEFNLGAVSSAVNEKLENIANPPEETEEETGEEPGEETEEESEETREGGTEDFPDESGEEP